MSDEPNHYCARCGLPDKEYEHLMNPLACVAALKRDLAVANTCVSLSIAQREEVERKLAAAQADTARLDFIESAKCDLDMYGFPSDKIWACYPEASDSARGATARAAIDEAMKAKENPT